MGKATASMRRHRWQVLVFFTEFLYMGLELLASRLMSPYFGITLDVWTAILGVVLLASAIGNHLGGFVADKESCKPWLGTSLFVLATMFFLLPYASFAIGHTSLASHVDVPKTLVASLALFVLPGICIGSVTPMVVGLYGRDNEGGVGRTSADVYVAMTLGGIAGTFATGFLLVPVLGSTVLSYVMGALSFILACVVMTAAKAWRRLWWMPSVAISLSAFGFACNPTVGQDAGGGIVDFWHDTQYGRVHVSTQEYRDQPIRLLSIDGGYESAMFLDEGQQDELVFDYTAAICHAVEDYAAQSGTEKPNVLCMGGGAYSVPRYLATHTGSTVDVMEIDDGVTEIAREWFHLGEVERQVGDRLEVISGDARVNLAASDETYDYIINDTFAGNVPVRTLATVEAAEIAKAHLNKGGAFLVNVIGVPASDKPNLLPWEVKTLEQVFEHVYVFPVADPYDATHESNWLVVATDSDLISGGGAVEVLGAGEVRVLTDDDSPVEWLASFGNKH